MNNLMGRPTKVSECWPHNYSLSALLPSGNRSIFNEFPGGPDGVFLSPLHDGITIMEFYRVLQTRNDTILQQR